MPTVVLKEGETVEGAIRRFKRKCEKAGVLSELKKRQHYEKPSVKRKKKALAARKKLLKRLAQERKLKINESRAKQTERILRAMDNPNFTLLAHPTGRVIEERAPYDVDLLRIVRHARQRGCFLELNAHPERLDLLDTGCRMAKEEGVLVAINSDAHGRDEFANLRFGIGQARRGWLEAGDVLNSRPLAELRKLLAGTR